MSATRENCLAVAVAALAPPLVWILFGAGISVGKLYLLGLGLFAFGLVWRREDIGDKISLGIIVAGAILIGGAVLSIFGFG